MAGSSRTDMGTYYPTELSGSIASQLAEDIIITLDDKLHMTEAVNIQTIQGPLNFSTSGSVHTFASPLNLTSTSVNTFAGAVNVTTTATNTFNGPMDFNGVADFASAVTFNTHAYFGGGTTYFISEAARAKFYQLDIVHVSTFGGGIDVNDAAHFGEIATFGTHAYFGNGTTYYVNNVGAAKFSAMTVVNTSTFSGSIDANSFVDFATTVTFNGTAYYGGGTTYYINSTGIPKFNIAADDDTYTGIVTNDSGVLKYRTPTQLVADLSISHTVPLYGNVREGDFSWGSTDEYLYNNSATSGHYYSFIYIEMDSNVSDITMRFSCNHVGVSTTYVTVTLEECAQGGSWTNRGSDQESWTGTLNSDKILNFTPSGFSVSNDRNYRLKIDKWNDGAMTTAEVKFYGAQIIR